MRTRVSIAATLALVATAACASTNHLRKTQKDGENLRIELAETYIEKGAYEAAIPLLSRAVAEFPENPRIHMLYATVLRERGLYPQAEREFKLAIANAPEGRYAAAYAGLGVLYDLERRPALAEAAHRQAIDLAPKHAGYWNNLGFSLYLAGRWDEAIAALEQALALDPGLTIAYNNLGFAYGRRGDYESAARCFRTAGGEVATLLNLALAYEQNGDDAMAAKLRADATVLAPDLEVP